MPKNKEWYNEQLYGPSGKKAWYETENFEPYDVGNIVNRLWRSAPPGRTPSSIFQAETPSESDVNYMVNRVFGETNTRNLIDERNNLKSIDELIMQDSLLKRVMDSLFNKDNGSQ